MDPSATDGAVLRITGLTKAYGSFIAVDHVSFSVGEGEVVGLLGPNGAGKTTTINMILGILKPTSGAVEVLGMRIEKRRSEIASKINFAAVYAHVPANLTVRQNLCVFALLYGIKSVGQKVNALLQEFDLEDFANAKTGLLSSGELSRLNLAKAMLNTPKLLLLDEPTASLDPSISRLVRDKIKDYALENRAGILWTSHNMNEIEEVCDRVLFLSHGKILLSGDPNALPAAHGKKDLEELFIAMAREPVSFKE
jgi:ABC-2 type transport system ATP-binding protein